MKAIILAAGRGSRLNEMTEHRPKGLVELGGRSLIDWQTAALNAAGITNITIVSGYRHEDIEAQGYETRYNANWASTNMVASLLCAGDLIDGPTIVSYSDIVYGLGIVNALIGNKAPLAVAYDTDWMKLWRARFEDPLDDAESLRLDSDGNIVEIGRKVDDLSKIEGQYLGLMRFTPDSFGWIRHALNKEKGLADRLDMTSLLSILIADGHTVAGVETSGRWCEIDTPDDLAVAEQMLARGELDNPFNGPVGLVQ